MLRDNRILFSKAGTISDWSEALSNIHSGSKVLNFESGDYLYIGSYLPFNHRFFDVKVANAIAASPTVSFWTGSAWQAAVDVVDGTKNAAGASLAQDGIISWKIDPNQDGWAWDDTDKMTSVTDLATQKLFGLYWVRITWSANLTGTTELDYVGHKFASEEALEAEYPMLARSALKNSWESGKTSWDEQLLLASEYVVQDLRGKRRKIVSPDQIMSWQLFERACVHRCAMIVFKPMGVDYEYQYTQALKDYGSAMDLRNFEIDESRNGNLEPAEKETRVEWLRR